MAAPSRFHASYVEANFRQRLLTALRSAGPGVTDLRILARDARLGCIATPVKAAMHYLQLSSDGRILLSY